MSTRTLQRQEDNFYDPLAIALRTSLYLLGLCIVVDGIFPQLSIFLLDGRDPYVQPIVKMTLAVAACIISLIHRDSPSRRIGAPALLLIAYLFIDSLFIGVQRNFSVAAAGLYASFFNLLLIMILQACEMRLSDVTVTRLLLTAFWINLIIEIAQFKLNQPILAAQSVDGNFFIVSDQFYGSTRAFGLFGSISAASSFATFIASITIAKFRKDWHPLLALTVFGACLVMIYVVRIRLGAIQLAICALSALVLRFYPRSGIATCLPYIGLAIAAGVIFWLATTGIHTTGISDSGSLMERVGAWRLSLASLHEMPIASILFGNGTTQHWADSGRNTGFVLDSMYLQIIFQIGICGLGVVLIYYVWLWNYLLTWARDSQSPLVVGAAAVWSSLLGVGIINFMYPNLSTYIIDLFLCVGGSGMISAGEGAE